MKQGRVALYALLALGLLGRVLVPTGFMPAPVAEGWPIKLCPAQAPAFSSPSSEGHHTGHHEDDPEPAQPLDAGMLCPAGNVVGFEVEITEADSKVALPRLGQLFERDLRFSVTTRPTPTLARGPPRLLLSES